MALGDLSPPPTFTEAALSRHAEPSDSRGMCECWNDGSLFLVTKTHHDHLNMS
jgi:hypothetical protein